MCFSRWTEKLQGCVHGASYWEIMSGGTATDTVSLNLGKFTALRASWDAHKF